MGEVRGGLHLESGTPVAVKLVTDVIAAQETYRRAFALEARAVAGLSHPHVVPVLDYGMLPEGTRAGLGLKAPTVPYLVMARAQGDLSGLQARDWPQVRAELLQLLSGLGHAHARGVIHRDLKAGNVLWHGDPDRPQLWLADFGIARVGDEGGVGLGTPTAKAPEQWLRHSWELGPRTDLYAVGCLAWERLTGAEVYPGLPDGKLRGAHLFRAPPALTPLFDLPEGTGAWLRALLSKRPEDRPASAAEAARGLRALGGKRVTVDFLSSPPPPASPGVRPPVQAWVGLVGLRRVPLVGRTAEQAVLWRTLADSVHEARPWGVVLSGPAGTGKSTLARWLCETAAEAGLARTVVLRHDPDGGGDPVRLVRRLLHCDRAPPSAVQRRVQAWLDQRGVQDPVEVAALTRLALGETVPDRGDVLGRFLERLGEPLVLWLDDLHHGPETLALLPSLLNRYAQVCVVATVRDEDVAADPDRERQLQLLALHDRVRACPVSPLPPRACRALAQALLLMEGTVEAELVGRSGGNPLMATQLVAAWLDAGLLIPGEGGLRLRSGVEVALPPDLHRAWLDRLGPWLAGRPAADGLALELAAVLGLDVGRDEWRTACRLAGVSPSSGLWEGLLRLALVRALGPGQWAFVHGMLRETLIQRARDGGRLARWHRAASRVLSESSTPEDLERLGRHLRRAGEPQEARNPLLAAGELRLARGDAWGAARVVGELEHTLQESGTESWDHRRGQLLLQRARLALMTGDPAGAIRQAHAAVQSARLHGWPLVLARGLRRMAIDARMRGDMTRAEALFDEAHGAAQAHGLDTELAPLCLERAVLRGLQGQLAQARVDLDQALARYVAARDPAGQARCWVERTDLHMLAGETQEALQCLGEAAANHVLAGSRAGLADCANDRGDVARKLGDLDQAEASFREAIRRYRETTVGAVFIPRVNLAQVLLLRGAEAEARTMLEDCLRTTQEQRRGPIEAVIRLILLACVEGPAWDEHLAVAGRLLADSGFTDDDVARAAWRGGLHVAEPARRRAAWELAWDHWTRLGRTEEADQVAAALSAL